MATSADILTRPGPLPEVRRSAACGGAADGFTHRSTAEIDPLLTKTQSDLPCRVVIEMASDLSNRMASTALRDVAFPVMMSDVHVD